MSSPNKVDNSTRRKPLHKGMVALKRMSNVVSASVLSVLVGFIPYDNNILGFKDYLQTAAGEGIRDSNKNLSNAIIFYCKGEVGKTLSGEDPLLDRLSQGRKEVISNLQDLGINRHVPDIGTHNVFICDLEPSNQRCFPPPARVVGGTNIGFMEGRDIKDMTIVHEIGHLVHNDDIPSWLKEYAVDNLSHIGRLRGLYSINHVWGNYFNENSNLTKIAFDPNLGGEDFRTLVETKLSSQEGISQGDRENIMTFVTDTNPEDLLQATVQLFEMENGDFWERILGIDLEQLQKMENKYVCDNAGGEKQGIGLRFQEYLAHVFVYTFTRFN